VIGIVPLAGPDFVRANGSVKALQEVDGRPLLRRALESRSWWSPAALTPDRLVFVLHDDDASRAFARDHLAGWYPAARHVFLSDYTGGAALSALAGLALLAHHDAPVCVDLVDILYDEEAAPDRLFAGRATAGALGLYFPSDRPFYSYLELSPEHLVLRAREKRVISRCASAGTYFFRSPAVYIAAVAHSLTWRAELTHRDLFFVCPTLNGVIEAGWEVCATEVRNVLDVSLAEKAAQTTFLQ
jgi:hypothetical protein